MSSKQPRVKRLFLINRDFQLRYTRLALLVGLASTVLTLVLILYPLFQFRILRFPDFLPTPFLIGIGLASVANFAMVACMGVLITHRIAGPMFSVVRHLRIMQTGRLRGELKVRDGDDLKYLVRNVNELIEYLSRTTAEDLERLARITASLASIKAQGDGAERLRLIAEAEQMAAELRQRLEGRIESEPGERSA